MIFIIFNILRSEKSHCKSRLYSLVIFVCKIRIFSTKSQPTCDLLVKIDLFIQDLVGFIFYIIINSISIPTNFHRRRSYSR